MSTENNSGSAATADASNSTADSVENQESANTEESGISASASTVSSTEDIDDVVDEMLDDGKDSGEEPKKDSKKKEEALKKKLKLKVKDKEFEEEIDWNDDARLTKAFQKEKAFDAASQELANMKKQFGGLIEALKGDKVLDVLRELGHDVDGLAEKHLTQLVEEAKKSPEQVQKEKMEAELKSLKEEKTRLSKEKEEKELESIRNQYATEIENDITKALDKAETILPKRNPKIVRAIAQNMLFAMQNGYPQVKASDVIPLVEQEYRKDLKELFDILPEDTIEALVGKPNLDRLRKKRLAKNNVKTETAKQIVQETGHTKETEAEANKRKKNYRDFFS